VGIKRGTLSLLAPSSLGKRLERCICYTRYIPQARASAQACVCAIIMHAAILREHPFVRKPKLKGLTWDPRLGLTSKHLFRSMSDSLSNSPHSAHIPKYPYRSSTDSHVLFTRPSDIPYPISTFRPSCSLSRPVRLYCSHPFAYSSDRPQLPNLCSYRFSPCRFLRAQHLLSRSQLSGVWRTRRARSKHIQL
jgi:hypothetical protein